MKIDFRDISIPDGIDRRSYTRSDVRKDFADIIYRMGAGIEAHALALKIYNSQGAEEYSDEECKMIRRFADRCNPAFIDAIEELFNQDKEADL